MRFLITAGPTREPIDSVRYIGNRSSGKVGLALARAAVEAGHRVTLLLGPVNSGGVERGCRLLRFETAADLQKLLQTEWKRHDVLIMAAAVADYRPAVSRRGKISRGGSLTIRLQPTPDLVAQAVARKKPGQRVIAFALEEPAKLEKRAVAKLRRKGVDAIVANPLTTMDSEAIQPVWLAADGERTKLPRMSKTKFARWLVGKITSLVPLPSEGEAR